MEQATPVMWAVVCRARLPKLPELERQGNVLDIKLKRSVFAPAIKAFVDYDDGVKEGQAVRLHNNIARIDTGQFAGQRLILKFF